MLKKTLFGKYKEISPAVEIGAHGKTQVKIPFNKPTLPEFSQFSEELETCYNTGMITNGALVRKFESEVEETLGVNGAVGVSCCTSGLMLAIKCLGLKGKVALPSFTFFATGHAAVWNGLEPVFVDIDPETFNISINDLRRVLDENEDISVVMPVHVFGNPCDVDCLAALARKRNLRLVYDSAHGMGARVGERSVGCFGDAEVFSMSPTKIVVAGEGGVVTVRDNALADKLKAGRDYGNPGDYNPYFVGLNARMSEFHAALASGSFGMLELNVLRRNAIAERYRNGLSFLRGITFQTIRDGNRSTFKDLTILVDEDKFGVSRDVLAWHLSNEGIDTRKYYWIPVHRTAAYWEKWGRKFDEELPVTNMVAHQALSLPIWSHMEMQEVDTVIDAVYEASMRADQIAFEYSKDVASKEALVKRAS
ncbi:MAG: DegT/DnrJ/EryC1/StrS family aminotransferase [Actinobacteria bacterium]|nr:DegT/DnrJ/EryC1/StrS family aminotransferase [Actinomycetota bacterium]